MIYVPINHVHLYLPPDPLNQWLTLDAFSLSLSISVQPSSVFFFYFSAILGWLPALSLHGAVDGGSPMAHVDFKKILMIMSPLTILVIVMSILK